MSDLEHEKEKRMSESEYQKIRSLTAGVLVDSQVRKKDDDTLGDEKK